MPIPLMASMPPGLELADHYTIRFTAIDPTTGNTVSGVVISEATIQVVNLRDTKDVKLASGKFRLIPGPGA